MNISSFFLCVDLYGMCVFVCLTMIQQRITFFSCHHFAHSAALLSSLLYSYLIVEAHLNTADEVFINLLNRQASTATLPRHLKFAYTVHHKCNFFAAFFAIHFLLFVAQ